MNAADRASELVMRWAYVYTRRLPDDVAARRRDELESDLWEQRSYGRQVAAPIPAVALSMLRRMVAGMPADLSWRQGQVAAARGTPLEREGTPVLAKIAHNWWLVLAALVAVFEVVFAVGIAQEGNPGSILGGTVIAAMGLLVFAGILRRRRSRVAGDVMIAIGALAAMPWFWLIAPTLASLAVIVAAGVDAAEAVSLTRRGSVSSGDRALAAVVVLLVAAIVIGVLVGVPVVGSFLFFVTPVIIGLVAYLVVRRLHRTA